MLWVFWRISFNHFCVAFRTIFWWWRCRTSSSWRCFSSSPMTWATNIIMFFYSWGTPVWTLNQTYRADSTWFTRGAYSWGCWSRSSSLSFSFFRFTFALHASSSNTAYKLWVKEIKSWFIFFTRGTVYKLTRID